MHFNTTCIYQTTLSNHFRVNTISKAKEADAKAKADEVAAAAEKEKAKAAAAEAKIAKEKEAAAKEEDKKKQVRFLLVKWGSFFIRLVRFQWLSVVSAGRQAISAQLWTFSSPP